MTSTTFFIIFIPVLSIILLFVNLILAPHNPYQEKDSVFECGFHSFLGQNRTQFSVSFFIFGLLFLLFDLEILLVYPYSVSGYTNDVYGLTIMMIFFVLLTLGFIFELGKNALSIDSKQTSYSNEETPINHTYLKSNFLGEFYYLLSSNSLFINLYPANLQRIKKSSLKMSYLTLLFLLVFIFNVESLDDPIVLFAVCFIITIFYGVINCYDFILLKIIDIYLYVKSIDIMNNYIIRIICNIFKELPLATCIILSINVIIYSVSLLTFVWNHLEFINLYYSLGIHSESFDCEIVEKQPSGYIETYTFSMNQGNAQGGNVPGGNAQGGNLPAGFQHVPGGANAQTQIVYRINGNLPQPIMSQVYYSAPGVRQITYQPDANNFANFLTVVENLPGGRASPHCNLYLHPYDRNWCYDHFEYLGKNPNIQQNSLSFINSLRNLP